MQLSFFLEKVPFQKYTELLGYKIYQTLDNKTRDLKVKIFCSKFYSFATGTLFVIWDML